MTESATTLASFNVDREAWEQFKALAKDNGLSASFGLNELIKQALQRGSISPIESNTQSIPDIDLSGYIGKSEFEAVIAQLQGELAAVSKPVELPDIEKMIGDKVDAALANLADSESINVITEAVVNNLDETEKKI